MTIHNIQLRLQLSGQQATQQMQRLNLQQSQAQQQQKQNLNQILQTQNRLNASVQQGGRYGQQQMRTGQSMVQTNRLLAQILQQQQRSSSLISQQLQQQQRSYQMQLNTLRSQVREAERLRQQLQQAGQAQRDNQRNSSGGGSNLIGGAAGSVMGGYMAAKGVIGTPLERARSFETKIFDAATSVSGGYANMSHQQIVASNKKLSDYARNAVRSGHGTVDGMGDAASILGASGSFSSVEELEKPLLAIAKGAFAAGAAEQDIAKLVKQLKVSGIAPDRIEVQLARMVKSGYLGSFELKDMAGLLPETLPYATKLGYTNEKGVNMVSTHMQIARQHTGIPSQANDNMRDLYSLMSQRHFRMAMYKYMPLEEGDPTISGADLGLRGKKQGQKMGFDVTQDFVKQMDNGIDPLRALAMRLDQKMSLNPEYVKLQNQLSKAVEKKDITSQDRIKAQLEIIGGAEMGEIFHNQQSLSGIMALMTGYHSGQFDSIEKQSWEDTGALNRVYDAKSEIEPAQAHALEQEAILATVNIYDKVKNTLGDFESGLTSTMRANQALTAAALAATGALTIMAGAGIGGKLLGGRSGGNGPSGGGMGGALGGKVGTVSLAAGQVALSGALGYAIGTEIRDMYMQTEAGQTADNWIGEKIAQTLALFGNDEAQAALDNNAKYEQMIAQQEQANKLSSDLSNKLSTLITATQNNKPIPFNTGSLLDGISNHVKTESARHGAPPAYMLVGK